MKGTAFVEFLDEFADALHAAGNRTLTVDVHGDGSTPFDFHVWGALYKGSKVDKVHPPSPIIPFSNP